MIWTSFGMPNFSRIKPAWRMIGSSLGDAASTPTIGVSSVTSSPPSAAPAAMSPRRVMPSNEMCDAASYARLRASRTVGPHPVAASTRPPSVTTLPSRSAVPEWNTTDVRRRRGGLEPPDRPTGLVRPRVAAAREHHRDRGVLGEVDLQVGEPVPRARVQQLGEVRRADGGSRPGSPGSPNRQLYSRTFGPARGEHQRPYRGVPSTRSPRRGARGPSTPPRPRSASSVACSSHGSGEYAPIPPVFGPVSPSPARLKSWASAERDHRGGVDQRERRHLGPLEHLLHDHPRARRSPNAPSTRHSSIAATARPGPWRRSRLCPPRARRP